MIGDSGKKGKTEIQRFEYLENKKRFLDQINSIFCKYLRAIIWWKNEKSLRKLEKNFIFRCFFSSVTSFWNWSKCIFVFAQEDTVLKVVPLAKNSPVWTIEKMFSCSWYYFLFQHHGDVIECLDLLVHWTYCNKLWNLPNLIRYEK